MVNIAVFASGSGTNFETILQHIEDGSLPVQCQCLIVDKEQAYARTRAKQHQIEDYYFNPKSYPNKEAYEKDILKVLKDKNVDLIVLSGYMRFIGKVLLEAYPKAIINLHPAYLPEFPGAHSIQDAFEAGVSQTGVTWKHWKSMYMPWNMTCSGRSSKVLPKKWRERNEKSIGQRV